MGGGEGHGRFALKREILARSLRRAAMPTTKESTTSIEGAFGARRCTRSATSASRATARPRSPTLSASEEPTPVSTSLQGVPPQVNEATSLAPDGERWPAASGARAE
eukprot:scaffold5562_cov116-Isochrysis_galbana.AAC.1